MFNCHRREMLVLAFAVAGFSLLPPARAAAQSGRPSTPVTIVNPDPLPVSGTFTLNGEGAVTITNSAANPVLIRDVDRTASVPFSQTFVISTTVCGCTNCCFPESALVPAGQRLVIEHVSGFFGLSGAGNMGPVTLQQRDAAGVTTVATVPVTARTQWNGGDYPAYEFSHPTKAYIEAGKSLRLSAFTSGSWNFTPGQVTITGQLVPVP